MVVCLSEALCHLRRMEPQAPRIGPAQAGIIGTLIIIGNTYTAMQNNCALLSLFKIHRLDSKLIFTVNKTGHPSLTVKQLGPHGVSTTKV